MPRGKQNHFHRSSLHDTFIVSGSISFVFLWLLAPMVMVVDTAALQVWADEGLEGLLLSPTNRDILLQFHSFNSLPVVIYHQDLHLQAHSVKTWARRTPVRQADFLCNCVAFSNSLTKHLHLPNCAPQAWHTNDRTLEPNLPEGCEIVTTWFHLPWNQGKSVLRG